VNTLLITGGSGYLGSHLITQARKRWRIMATYFTQAIDPPGCQAVPLDVADGKAVSRLLTDVRPAAIIHTAADMSTPEAMQAVIVEGTQHVVAAAAAIGTRFIHLSTDALFDGEHAPYVESDPPRPITAYGRAKAAAEQVVAETYPAASIVRTSLLYGFDPIDTRSAWVVNSLRQARPITLYTDEVRCPVWVAQLAAALLELAEGQKDGTWHLAGPQPLSRYEFGEKLARAYNLDPAGITPGLSRESGQIRPRDCTLDVGKAQRQLRSPLWGVDKVLAQVKPTCQRGDGQVNDPRNRAKTTP
jgi:dTDP-4-dehydrorhamnose reductase